MHFYSGLLMYFCSGVDSCGLSRSGRPISYLAGSLINSAVGGFYEPPCN